MRVRCRINQEDRTRPGASSVGYCITAAAENFVELKAGPTDRAHRGFSSRVLISAAPAINVSKFCARDKGVGKPSTHIYTSLTYLDEL
jgi:hypothetical protein